MANSGSQNMPVRRRSLSDKGQRGSRQRTHYRNACAARRSVLCADEVFALENMIETDDISLKSEFHALRALMIRTMERFRERSLAIENGSSADVIDEIHRLVVLVDRLSSIAEKRAKIRQIAPNAEGVVRVEFSDPSFKLKIKESLRRMETVTIKRVLATVLLYLDPNGELGVAKKLPTSFAPFLPSAGKAAEEPAKSIDAPKP